MIKTVVFDMDGVIIDSEPIHMEIQNSLFSRFGIAISQDEYLSYIGRSSKNMWQELIQKFDLGVSVEEILALDKQEYHLKLRSLSGLKAISGVDDLIGELHNESLNLLLASSSSMESISLVLDLFQLDRMFPNRISGADLEWSKPHPQIFIEAAKLTGNHPQECVVIEDSRHGVSAAKSAGMFCIGYQNPNSGNQDLRAADLIVDDFTRLTVDMIMDIHGK
ncbi:MAG: HAD family phosphatase [Cyclobacteriaceae bacterium]|nr:HAD family phosphatase [Cyclobacteriaceae bacterium]